MIKQPYVVAIFSSMWDAAAAAAAGILHYHISHFSLEFSVQSPVYMPIYRTGPFIKMQKITPQFSQMPRKRGKKSAANKYN